MSKPAHIVLLLLSALLLFSGCTRTQAPTPSGGGSGGSAQQSGALGDDFITGGLDGDFGSDLDGLGLQGRDGFSGMFGDRERVEGVLEPVFFGFDQSSIASNERGKLQEAANYLENNPDVGLLIEGRCDWYGTAEYNLALGDRRANSVRDFLVTLGVSSGRIETVSKGDLEATPNLPKDQSQQDRRADLVILR